MAIICHLQTFHKLPFSSLPSRHSSNNTHCPNIPRFQNQIFASTDIPRGRLKVRSNTDLCNEIREFLSVAGLPQDHVPTTEELAQHGRQDLANIVRRRGYKFIRELLGTSKRQINGEPNSEEEVFRGRLKAWSKTDLCNDILEFLSVAGLPQDHVPTTEELAQHGRKDLANIVRRRGYKFIRELLGTSKKQINGEPNSKEVFSVRRKVRSNTDLCNDIREFLSVAGLPQDHVPTLEELAQHGRQDLAHIVRSRGYKFIRDLLGTSKKQINVEPNSEEVFSGRRMARSNTDLCNDIREFLSVAGLPQDHTPTMEELARHGRHDLVNSIRRRGFKFIRELLGTSKKQINGETCSEKVQRKVRSNTDLRNDIREFLSLAGLPQDHIPTIEELAEHGRHDLANIVRRRGFKFIRDLLGTSKKQINDEPNSKEGFGEDFANASPEGQDEKTKILVDDVSSFSKAFVTDGGLNLVRDDGEFNSFKQSHVAEESSVYPSLREKVSNFIQNGELDDIEDSDFDFLKERNSEDVDGRQNAEELRSAAYDEQKEDVLREFNDAEILNGMILSSTQQLDHAVQENTMSKHDFNPDEEATSAEDKGEHVKNENVENQAEINRLKFMLHQKGLELTRLKQQIEEEKRALSALLTKAETEMNKARELISAKDAELIDAEESLSGLKEVEIQYRGDGESVEVAGSFNGWHHKIKMDPQASSTIIDPQPVKSQLWRTVLWLYPGIYEIKFLIDGHWRTDPEMELVKTGTIENNVLRVER